MKPTINALETEFKGISYTRLKFMGQNYRNSETTVKQLSIVKSYSQYEFLLISIISPGDTETVEELPEDYYDS